MKSLSKIFLLIISLGNFIYPSYKDKPLPELPREHRKPDQSKPLPPTPFFIIRFQSTGDEKADKKLESLLNNSKKNKYPDPGVLTFFFSKHFVPLEDIIGEKYFNEIFKINEDIKVPKYKFYKQDIEKAVFDVAYLNLDGTTLGLKIDSNKKYIFRYRKCNAEELKQEDRFKQLNFSNNKKVDSYFCVEIQDLKEQQKKLKEELEQALPDMPGDLRNVIQGYVGTDVT